MSLPKRFVYVIKTDPGRYDTGITSDIAARLKSHNAGGCPHTADATSWRLVVAIEFAEERRAIEFERYLKSGSGVAFSQRHFR